MAATINHLAASTGDKHQKGKHTNNVNEPLQRFKEAKMFMGDIYKDLYGFVNELFTFYSGLDESCQKFVPAQQKTEVVRFKESIRAIKEMIGRDKMKVVFFGRTSNGKSSVVNAMLGSKILPQGMGHTTCCFLQVEGGLENEKYFTMEDDETKFPLEKLQSVGDALVFEEGGALGKDSLIRISYPKSASKLLQNDVVIVDSPGIDLSPEFDSWIDKHCLDADVFVLVCNSEATLTQAEKNFFNRVSKKLSRPNIFILCNRWDASATESNSVQQQIRSQHEKRFVNFLSNELKVCTPQEANNRFFFISAREMMDVRLKERGQLMTTGYQQEGFQRRALEFKNFEEQFEKCISKSAIRTKFEAHNRSGREMVSAIQDNLDTTLNAATQEKKKLALDYKLKINQLNTGRENYRLFVRTYQEQQQKLRAEVHMKVSADFMEEISRLEAIIDRFKHPFGDDQATIEDYKKELANYVNNLVTEELQNQCTGGLMSDIWTLENSMHSYVKQILNDEHAVELDRIWRYRQPFKFVVTVNCPQLVADFHEDLEFRFSLGFENIARWILSVTKGQPITSIDRNILRLSPTRNSSDARIAGEPNKQEVDVFLSNVIVQSAAYLVNGSVGLTIVGLVIYKNVDWRWILAGAGSLAGFYLFERLRWDNGAKEERLKNQFRQHLEQRLHQTESIHTSQCEQQLIRELEQVYTGLQTVVGGYHREMKEDIDKTKKTMDKLESTVSGISTIKNKITFMSNALESFATRFLNGGNSPC